MAVNECEDSTTSVVPVSHEKAMEMLDSCITWLQSQPEGTSYNISVLISLRETAARKRMSALKQSRITSFMQID